MNLAAGGDAIDWYATAWHTSGAFFALLAVVTPAVSVAADGDATVM